MAKIGVEIYEDDPFFYRPFRKTIELYIEEKGLDMVLRPVKSDIGVAIDYVKQRPDTKINLHFVDYQFSGDRRTGYDIIAGIREREAWDEKNIVCMLTGYTEAEKETAGYEGLSIYAYILKTHMLEAEERIKEILEKVNKSVHNDG